MSNDGTGGNVDGARHLRWSNPFNLMQPLSRKWMPSHKWSSQSLDDILDTWSEERNIFLSKHNPRRTTYRYIFTAIILAVLYAMCCNSLFSEVQIVGNELFEFTVYPDLISIMESGAGCRKCLLTCVMLSIVAIGRLAGALHETDGGACHSKFVQGNP